jgi:uncharacterized membrane protein HdeD (DUF308 family)
MASNTANNDEFVISIPTPWWVVLLEGIFALLIGLFLVFAPGTTSVFLVTVLGLYFLIRGVIALVQMFTGSTGLSWGWLLFSGIIGIIAGLAVLRHPLYATVLTGNILVIIVAVAALIMGVGGLIMAFTGAGWGTGILSALSIFIAFGLFANLLAATKILPFVIAGFMIIGGIVAIVFSFSVRKT